VNGVRTCTATKESIRQLIARFASACTLGSTAVSLECDVCATGQEAGQSEGNTTYLLVGVDQLETRKNLEYP
jgi:hypothetical protein